MQMALHAGVETPDWVLTGFAAAYAPLGGAFDALEILARDAVSGTAVEGWWKVVDDWVLANQCEHHVDKLPLMNLFHVWCIISLYLVTIFSLCLVGDRLPNFKGMKVFRGVQICHNVILILLSAYMCWETLRQAAISRFSFLANAVVPGPQGWPMAKIVWLFYVSKWYEYLDTVFMCLRKNWVQVSFLHVYHHFATFLIWWGVSFLAPGGEGYYAVVLNTFVHVIMYSYYFYTTMGWKFPLKFYITYIQMAQFVLNILHAGYGIWFAVPGFPNVLRWVSFLYMFTLLFLFWNFMRHAKKRIREQKALKVKKQN